MFEYYPPKHGNREFHCPYCNVYAHQYWNHICEFNKSDIERKYTPDDPISLMQGEVEISTCSHCRQITFWSAEKMIYPPTRSAPPANSDLPDDIKQVYDEAAAIADQSPRAACALLRLAIEMLMRHLGETGSINDSIKNLVKKDPDTRVQQSLDIVRITGNNAIHPGEIAFDDTTDVQAIFELINIIADNLITRSKKIQALYDRLPEDSKKAIEKRDGKTQ